MKHAALALAACLCAAAATASDFYCSNTSRIQIAQTEDGYEAAAATGTKNARRGARHKVERFDVLQAYSGQPVLVGSTWLTACMMDPAHPDTRSAFGGLIGLNPDSAANMAKSTGLVDRGIRLTRDMHSCLTDNAPAVGYSSLPIGGQGVKPCF